MFKPGSPDKLQLSTVGFGGLGARMMKGLADDDNGASLQDLLEVSQELGVKPWSCQMTMDLTGLRAARSDGWSRPAGWGRFGHQLDETGVDQPVHLTGHTDQQEGEDQWQI